MPGFMITGSENSGNDASPWLMEVRRTHRWYFESMGLMTNKQVALLLKSAQRPSFNFEEPQMHHNQEQIYFAGKHTWEPISFSWYDVEQPVDVSDTMYKWLTTVINLLQMTVEPPTTYKARTSGLHMVDGAGVSNEDWTIYGGWPQSVNWNALDYSSSDLQLIEVKFRFDRAVKGGNGPTVSATASV